MTGSIDLLSLIVCYKAVFIRSVANSTPVVSSTVGERHLLSLPLLPRATNASSGGEGCRERVILAAVTDAAFFQVGIRWCG